MTAVKSLADEDYSELSDRDRKFIDDVQKYGWKSTYVFETDESPSFIYSTGFWRKFRKPEILIFSMPQDLGHKLLWNIFHDYEAGKAFEIGKPIGDIFEQNGPIFFPANSAAKLHNCTYADWFYRRVDFDCLQFVWSDENGLFPWQEGFAERYKESPPDVSDGGWEMYLKSRS